MITEDQYKIMLMRMGVKNPPVAGPGVERESELHEQIREWCDNQIPKWIALHGSMAHRTKRTIAEPDFVLVAPRGRFFLIECKRPGGKLSPEQLAMKVRADVDLQHTIHVVHSMDEFISVVNG